jgi:hypothetical protein
VFGPAQEAPPGQSVTGTFETGAPPAAVGIYERNDRIVFSRTGEDPGLSITSPSATVMGRDPGQPAAFDRPLLVNANFEDAYVTAPGLAALEPGTYEYEVTDHRDVGAAFGGFALVYANAAGAN